MPFSAISLCKTCDGRIDTATRLLKNRCNTSWKSARETGSEKSGCPFFAVRRQHLFSGDHFVEPSPFRGLFHEMNEGWVKLHRSLQDHPRSNDGAWMVLWVHLLMLATHKPHRIVFGKAVIELKPGQLITSRLSLAAKTGLHESRVERLLKTMIFEQQIEQQSSFVSRLITICNWSHYQSTEQAPEQQSNSSRTAPEQQSNTNKNDKNGENERNLSLELVVEGQPPQEPSQEEIALRIYDVYPKKVEKQDALKAIVKALSKADGPRLMEQTTLFAQCVRGCNMQFVPHPARWFNAGGYESDPEAWKLLGRNGADHSVSNKRNEGMTNKVTVESGNQIAAAARATQHQARAK